MRRSYTYIVIALSLTTILILYNYLGGFNEPEITFEPVTEYVFRGKYIEGKASDPAIEELFTEMKSIKLENQYKGPLVMIWYNNVSTRNDSVNVFIGLEMLPGEHPLSFGETIRIQMMGLVRAKIAGHASVIPSPSNVTEKLKAFSIKNKYELQDLFIDKYFEESIVYTEIPVKSIKK